MQFIAGLTHQMCGLPPLYIGPAPGGSLVASCKLAGWPVEDALHHSTSGPASSSSRATTSASAGRSSGSCRQQSLQAGRWSVQQTQICSKTVSEAAMCTKQRDGSSNSDDFQVQPEHPFNKAKLTPPGCSMPQMPSGWACLGRAAHHTPAAPGACRPARSGGSDGGSRSDRSRMDEAGVKVAAWKPYQPANCETQCTPAATKNEKTIRISPVTLTWKGVRPCHGMRHVSSSHRQSA